MKRFFLLTIMTTISMFVVITLNGQSWTNLGCSINGGTRTLVVEGNTLYGGGVFSDKVMNYTLSGGCQGMGYSGTNADVRGMAVYNGDLYVAGAFNWPTDSGRVYKFNNGNWSVVGTFDGWVIGAMTVYNGSLYCGGGFTEVNGVAASNVARWDGNSWSDVGGGIPGGMFFNQIRAMTVYNNELIVAGSGLAPFANDIARWNGVSWNTLGNGITGVFNTGVYALQTHGGLLYASGRFDFAGSQPCNNIASWNGAGWSALGSGISGGDTLVVSMASYNGFLYAGGSFTEAGGVQVANVARWNGSWSDVGNGLSSATVTALAVYMGSLVAASGYSSPNFYYAVWKACPATINATGATTVCGGSVPLAASSGTAYQWYLNGNLLFGANTSNYLANISGNYMCIITTGCGETFSNTISITVNPLPAATISPSGPTTFCALGSVALNANTGAGLTYKWYKYGNLVPGATSSSYVASTSGKYKVEVRNVYGCIKKSPAVTVVVNPLPTASISAGGSTSICAGDSVMLMSTTNIPGSTFQWKRYANIISGANGSAYYAKLTGNYKALVTSPAGCVRASNGILVNVVCREGNFSDNTLAVYPNPVSSKLYINSENEKITQLTLLNTIGSEIYNETIHSENNNIEINFSELPGGIYFLKITTEKEQTIKRIVRE